MPSSSSLVQEKGRPEMKSLCFSRVVLYLNTYKKAGPMGGQSSPLDTGDGHSPHPLKHPKESCHLSKR